MCTACGYIYQHTTLCILLPCARLRVSVRDFLANLGTDVNLGFCVIVSLQAYIYTIYRSFVCCVHVYRLGINGINTGYTFTHKYYIQVYKFLTARAASRKISLKRKKSNKSRQSETTEAESTTNATSLQSQSVTEVTTSVQRRTYVQY